MSVDIDKEIQGMRGENKFLLSEEVRDAVRHQFKFGTINKSEVLRLINLYVDSVNLVEKLEEFRKSVTKPFLDAKKEVDAKFNDAGSDALETAEFIKGLVKAHPTTFRESGSTVVGFGEIVEIEVVDINAVPDTFKKVVVNLDLVRGLLAKAGKDVEITGLKFIRKTHLRRK